MTDSSFQVLPLDLETFRPLFETDDLELRRRGIRRVTATAKPGFPCRVSLEDADVGETVLLLNHPHHDTDGPYRASGPIYVRERAEPARLAAGELPPVVDGRRLSVRAYSATGMMRMAAVCEAGELRGKLDELFADPKVAYLNVHNALPGCFSCRVERAEAA
ncbi:MAG: DUF1203 domain-containing protein [Acidobacteriota bacterium]